MNLATILVLFLIVLIVSGGHLGWYVPTYGYGGGGLLLIILLVLILSGRV